MTEIISLAAEFVADFHVDMAYADLCTRIEDRMRERKYKLAANGLFQLFSKMAKGKRVDENTEEDIPSCLFWDQEVTRLLQQAPDEAFRLAYKCANAIEDNLWTFENLQILAYTLGTASSHVVLNISPDYADRGLALNKVIMQRSSELENGALAERIFDRAADAFLLALELYPPSERYDHVFELSLWLGEREHPSELLQEFVDDMMAVAEEYEKGIKYIPDVLPQHEERPTHLTLVYSRAPE